MKPHTLLVIDDDADDRIFFSEAIKKVSPDVETHYCESGIQAIDMLFTRKIVDPDYIFLDMNMPMMNGKECLRNWGNSFTEALPK